MAACIDSPIEFFFDRTDASGVTSGQCLVISLSAADKYAAVGSSELVPMFFRGALATSFPAARDAGAHSAVVTREHAATFRAAPGIESTAPAQLHVDARSLPRGRLVRHRLARHHGRRGA